MLCKSHHDTWSGAVVGLFGCLSITLKCPVCVPPWTWGLFRYFALCFVCPMWGRESMFITPFVIVILLCAICPVICASLGRTCRFLLPCITPIRQLFCSCKNSLYIRSATRFGQRLTHNASIEHEDFEPPGWRARQNDVKNHSQAIDPNEVSTIHKTSQLISFNSH